MFCYTSVIFIVFILLPSLLPVCAQEWMKMILCSSDSYMQWIINIYCSMDISVFQWTLLIWQLTYYYEWMHHFKWIIGQQIYWSQWTMMTITLELLNYGTMIHPLIDMFIWLLTVEREPLNVRLLEGAYVSNWQCGHTLRYVTLTWVRVEGNYGICEGRRKLIEI